jgi:hypothetical protein
MVYIAPSPKGRFITARNEPLNFIKEKELLDQISRHLNCGKSYKMINMVTVRNFMVISENYTVTGIHISGKSEQKQVGYKSV